tara:strand:- start:2908 stop:5418 length:2511 start_codon:yes stop_codon:yes gene_type:complete
MAERESQPKHHFIFKKSGETESFRRRGGGGDGNEIPRQNRQSHGQSLLQQVEGLKADIQSARELQEEAGLEDGFGLQIEFESFPDIELAFERLAVERSKIELLNVRHEDGKTFAAVFVPDGKMHLLESKITDYLRKSNASGSPKNQILIDAIQSIRKASIRSLWTDDPKAFPTETEEVIWWEVWLPLRGDRFGTVAQFRELAEGLRFRVAKGQIEFPERTVLLVQGSLDQMQRSMLTLNSIAELRRAKETADFFDSLSTSEQPEWIHELLSRLTIPEAGAGVPHVCVLDTGINQGHPLLARGLAMADCHTVEPGWGTDDGEGHGTEMAGLALLGNLTLVLSSSNPIDSRHRLESVKLLESNHSNGGDPEYHGYLTIQAIGRPEITAPHRLRVFSMSVTAKDSRDRGRPSAWSATIDRLAVDYDNQGESPRLFCISAGNVDDPNAWINYPDSNTTDAVHDPGQAWNAITVGASTDLVNITEPDTADYSPVAQAGALSPFSTTSQVWAGFWPYKPDIVFEGGNAAVTHMYEKPYASTMASLSLLTTNFEPTAKSFTTTNATSAATALAARMAAQIMAEYPDLRAETIRGLMVHSADWTATMKRQWLPNPARPNKSDVAHLIRHCGFGEPDLERALWSVENSLTLICEDVLHPFKRDGSKAPTLRDMNLHRLPWPLQELEALGEVEVEMRVTLSYFIEPNPSARGVKSRYRYESHGLRFEVKRPDEGDDAFRSRINAAAQDADEGGSTSTGNDPHWLVGPSNRHRGSIHSDIWRGSAADLASRGVLAVYPVSGWWKTRQKLERYDQSANYSLIISVLAPEIDVELYTAIENQLKVLVEV